jgi:hypothetical protein
MYENYQEDSGEFNVDDLNLEQLIALRGLISQLATGEAADLLLEGTPTSRLSEEQIAALTHLEAQEIRIEAERRAGKSDAYKTIAAEIDARIDRLIEEGGFSGLS